jgi:hypothetical protein
MASARLPVLHTVVFSRSEGLIWKTGKGARIFARYQVTKAIKFVAIVAAGIEDVHMKTLTIAAFATFATIWSMFR